MKKILFGLLATGILMFASCSADDSPADSATDVKLEGGPGGGGGTIPPPPPPPPPGG